MVFIFPSIVKIKHHHNHLLSSTKNEKQRPVFHEKCAICNFEFSVFLTGTKQIELCKENPPVHYCNNYHAIYYSNLPCFSFLLRAPPSVKLSATA